MARPTNVTDNGLSADFGKPLAVPDLAVAAQLLGQPLDRVKDAATTIMVYPGADGTTYYSLRQLALALGVVESREERRHRTRVRAAS